jgi:cell division GTPase FtsZ
LKDLLFHHTLESKESAIRLPFERTRNFKKKCTETHRGIQAMAQAISNLSLRCDPKDSGSALYLLSAPKAEMNMNLVKELGDWLRDVAPEATIRYGDYPRSESTLKITVILSQLNCVEKVKEYYGNLVSLTQGKKKKQKYVEAELQELIDAATEIPSLL